MQHDKSYTGQDFKVVGTRVKRPDGVDKVTGRARYGADAFAPGQLVGRVLRSPHAHAKIVKILFDNGAGANVEMKGGPAGPRADLHTLLSRLWGRSCCCDSWLRLV